MGSADSHISPGFVAWGAAAVFGVSLVFFSLFFDYGLAVLDEGVLIQGIRLQAEGRMDFAKFCHYSSLYRWFSLLFSDGRPNLEVVRAVWVVIRSATAVLIFLISARVVSKRWAWVPVVLFLSLPGPWHKAFVAFSLCLCLHAMVRLVGSASVLRYVWLALCVAFAFAVHPYTAVPTLLGWVGVAAVVPALRRGPFSASSPLRRFLLWHGSFGLALVVFTVLLADYVRQVNPFTLGAHNLSLIVSIASGSRILAAQLGRCAVDPQIALILSMYLMVLPIMAIALWIVLKDGWSADSDVTWAAVLCLVIVGLPNLSKWVIRLDLSHFLQNAAPIWILLVFVLSRLVVWKGGWGGLASCAIGALFCSWIAVIVIFGLTSSDIFVGSIGTRLFTDTVDLPHPHGVLHVKPKVRDSLQSLERAIRDNSSADDPVLICASPKILYYLAERQSPLIVPMIVFPSSSFATSFKEMAAEIRRKKTAVILFQDSPIIPRERFRLVNLAPELYSLITTEYQLVDEIDGIQIRTIRSVGAVDEGEFGNPGRRLATSVRRKSPFSLEHDADIDGLP